MGKLHSQLALFGSIDDEVVKRNDPRTTAIVESFLPGTTGYGQRGWFGELRNFVNQLAPSGRVEFPSREEALGDLIRTQPVTAPAADGPQSPDDGEDEGLIVPRHQAFVREITRGEFEELLTRDEAPPEPISPPTPESLPWSTFARATYAAAVIAKVDGTRREAPVSRAMNTICLRWGDRGILKIRGEGESVEADPLTTLLEMAVPHQYTRGLNLDTLPLRPSMRDIISDGRVLERGRPDWQPLMARIGRDRAVNLRVAAYPPPCVGVVRKIGADYCTVVSTEVFADVRLEELEAIVDPRNWQQDLPSFFCRMEPRADDAAGWSQILECVSTECSEYRLQTALKYWNAERSEDGIFINYDLAGDRTGDSGLVEVDSGYIWIARAQPTGVRIKTSKALKICGLSPTATAALACYSGWAQVGIDMLVNAALHPHHGAVEFDPSTLPSSAAVLSQGVPVSPETAQVDATEARLPQLPPGFRQDVLHDAAEQVDHYIDATSRLAKNFARRWQNGLTRTDVQRFGELVGKEMTDLAVGSFDSVMGNFRPKVHPVAGDEVPADPMPRKTDLLDRLADTARHVVEESTSVAQEAADKIDVDTYTGAEMTATANKLAGIAMKGWGDVAGIAVNPTAPPAPAPPPTSAAPSAEVAYSAAAEAPRIKGNGLGAILEAMSDLANRTFLMNLDLVKDAIDQRVPDVATVVTEHMAMVIRRMATQAKAVAEDAAMKLDGEGYSADDWAKTITKLGDVALINGIELAGTALVGPGRYEIRPITSDLFVVANAAPTQRHKLTLAAPLALAGSNDGEVISEDRVTFDPPSGVLRAGRSAFRIRVKATGLRSGVYLGAVWAIPVDATGAELPSDEIGREVVPVIIGL